MSDTATPPPSQPPTQPQYDHSPAPESPGWKKALKVIGVSLALATGLPWLYVAVTQNTIEANDELVDSPFPAAAEEICAAAMDDVASFPPAHETDTLEQRVAVIQSSTDRLAEMTRSLRDVVPEGDDAKWINTWIDHYEIHLQDRYDFADRLTTEGPSSEFFESELEGTQISKSINRYAGINSMESCETPGDV